MTQTAQPGHSLFRPGPRSLNWLIPLGLCTLGWAMYMRYMMVEPALVRLACDAGLASAGCYARSAVMVLMEWSVFGGVALVAALVHFIAPSLAAFAVALVFSACALVFHNEIAGALAVMLLILSFARRGPATA